MGSASQPAEIPRSPTHDYGFEARSSAAAAKAQADENMHEKLVEFQHRSNHPVTASVGFAKVPNAEVLQRLSCPSLDTGLSSEAVKELTEKFGLNELKSGEEESKILKFLGQFYESPLNLLLFGSAGVSALLGNYDDAVSISLAIVIVVTVGFVQEQRSEKSLEALNQLVPHHCRILRDRTWRTDTATVLVPGDVVHLSTGDRVPADVRLLEASDLEIDESNLTGETRPALKTSDAILSSNVSDISERTNIAFMGTLVKAGRGKGVVVSTGDKTEFGVIFSMMQEIQDRKTPLQDNMDNLAQKLSAASFAIIGVICLIGVYQKRSWLEMFTIGVSLAVAAIPEGLPIVVTVTLALGVLRMSKRQAIVKKLPSVETLGSVSVICSDKTGTLTTNEMTVVRLFTVEDDVLDVSQSLVNNALTPAQEQLLRVGNICNSSFKSPEGNYVGQSTEVALINAATGLLGSDARSTLAKVNETPFNSEQKWQSVTGTHPSFSNGSSEFTFLTGAPETVLAACNTYARSGGSTAPLDASLTTSISSKGVQLASQLGVRLVAMAYGPMQNVEKKGLRETGFTFVGWQAMLDPPREGVQQAIAALDQAGVKTVMITGDAESTARSIAEQLGIKGAVMTGKEIDSLTTEQLAERIESVEVFARTTPRHKMSIIAAYQTKGMVVAMTGDGVNDAPALKMADIGISMGRGGTDVAKEAADMILVDDNFATIIPAVEEGKGIFYNIQNFLVFQLSTAVAALSLVTISTALQLPNPLNAMQILFINILMDGPPSQSLGVDPVDQTVMKQPPRPKDEPVLSARLLLRIAFSALMVVVGTLFIYVVELSDGELQGRDQTMTFTGFVFLDLVSAVQNRGLTCGLLANRMLVLTCSISFSVQLLLIYFPPLQSVFQTESLSVRDLGVLLALAATSATLHEIRRRIEKAQAAKAAKSD